MNWHYLTNTWFLHKLQLISFWSPSCHWFWACRYGWFQWGFTSVIVSVQSDHFAVFYGFPVLLHKAKSANSRLQVCSVWLVKHSQKLGFCVSSVHLIILIVGLYSSRNVFHQGVSLAQKEASLVLTLPVSPNPSEYLCQSRREAVLQDTSRGKSSQGPWVSALNHIFPEASVPGDTTLLASHVLLALVIWL